MARGLPAYVATEADPWRGVGGRHVDHVKVDNNHLRRKFSIGEWGSGLWNQIGMRTQSVLMRRRYRSPNSTYVTSFNVGARPQAWLGTGTAKALAWIVTQPAADGSVCVHRSHSVRRVQIGKSFGVVRPGNDRQGPLEVVGCFGGPIQN